MAASKGDQIVPLLPVFLYRAVSGANYSGLKLSAEASRIAKAAHRYLLQDENDDLMMSPDFNNDYCAMQADV